MADLISEIRRMISDPSNANQQFDDLTIQTYLDSYRDDIRYEPLTIAPSIVNNANTGNQAVTIYADYYSQYKWWEADVALQANSGGNAWVIVTPTNSNYVVGHWQFENSVFATGTAPGQLPPVFATGKVYDLNAVAADMLEFWCATLVDAYDIVIDSQSLRRSQMITARTNLAAMYRRKAKPQIAKAVRNDIMMEMDTRGMRLLDASDSVRGQ